MPPFASDLNLANTPTALRITVVTGFFLPVPALRGGATEKIWHGMARIFAARGHAVTFVSRAWPGLAQSELDEGIRHLRLPGFDHTRSLAANLLLDFRWGIRVARALPPADVVICNTLTLPCWLRFARPSAGSVVVMIGRTPKGQVAFYRGASRIYVPSSHVAARIGATWAAARTRVVGYPVDWPLLSGCAARKGASLTVGYVGRIHPEKGIGLLLRAACELAGRAGLPDWRLRLVGPTEVAAGGGGESWLAALKQECSPRLEGRVDWLPAEFNPQSLARQYGGIDIFCYPSVAERGETFGVAAAEAMAAGCAAVVSGLGCFGDLVRDGETGLVFDHAAEHPEKRLADCIGRLMTDPKLRNEIASRGQLHARHFDYPEVAGRILEDLHVLTGIGEEKAR